MRQARDIVDNEAAGLRELGEAAEKLSHTLGPSQVQADTAAGAVASADAETIAWDAFRKSVLYDKGESTIRLVLGSNSAMKAAIQGMKEDAHGAIFSRYADAKRSLIKSIGSKPKPTKKEAFDPEAYNDADLLDEKIKHSAAPDEVPAEDAARRLGDSGGGEEIHVLRSFLSNDLIKIQNGSPAAPGYMASDIKRMIGAIDADVALGAWKNTRTGTVLANASEEASLIRQFWKAGSEATKTRSRIYKTKVVQELIKTDNAGNFVIGEGPLEALLFKPRDTTPLKNILEGGGDVPETRQQLVHSLEKIYHDRVLRDGKPSLKAHHKFMDDYAGQLDILIGKGANKIQHSGDLMRALKGAQEHYVKTEIRLKSAFGDALVGGKVTPGGLSKAINRMKPAQVKRAMLVLDETPGLKKLVQRDYLDNLFNQLVKKDGTELKVSTVNTIIGTTHSRNVMTEVLGKKYVQNLTDLRTLVHASNAHKRVFV